MAERNENLLTALGSSFTKELNLIVQQVLIQKGVKQNSELVDSVAWEYSRDGLLMYVSDYYRAVAF